MPGWIYDTIALKIFTVLETSLAALSDAAAGRHEVVRCHVAGDQAASVQPAHGTARLRRQRVHLVGGVRRASERCLLDAI